MRRLIAFAAAACLLAVLGPGASAADPKPSIEDPVGDANFLNDQGTGDGSFGDQVTPADASDFADIEEVIFTNDKKNVYVHIVTVSSAPPIFGEGFRVRTNPDGPGGIYCFNFEVFFMGAQNTVAGTAAHLNDACGGVTVEGTAMPGIYGGYTITIPRSEHEALGKGKKLTAPQAQTFMYSGSPPAAVPGPYLDTTKVGSDYKLKK